MIRTRDAGAVNSWVRRDFPEAGDLGPYLEDGNNVCLAHGEGGAIFVWRGPGIYEAHCFLEQRGREALDTVSAMLRTMFEDYGARLIWSAILDRKVKLFVRRLGWKSLGPISMPYGECELFSVEDYKCPL